jgi:hypothetical protein
MAFTRYNYDANRTQYRLDQSTINSRYIFGVPWIFSEKKNPDFIDEPHIRLERWGGNLGTVKNGHPIDIDSELIGLTKKNGVRKFIPEYNKKFKPDTVKFETNSFNIDETRASNPAFLIRDEENKRWDLPSRDYQKDAFIEFEHNVDSAKLYTDKKLK